ncbi:acetate uptake transporter [Sporomusa malonica]|uniref:Uncharacterized protein n=1 Tax=Sporomusa malonica TaxID=112901 RepID=A0A1W2AFY1_9FIRM|nr:GPR1/FUN34/YaaH family transporter [Sporomusa malonica]SMC59586.1 hypothetical protein SAMN04488500_105262 [Sporomusa malonica]
MSINTNNTQTVKIVTADPGGLGLFGLAMVTLVASSQKLGWTTGFSFVIPWAIFLGAIAQVIASFNDFKHNNTFGATAFGAYGLFWLSVAACWLIKMGAFGPELAANVDGKQLGVAFIGYLIFSVYMTIGSMETNKVLFIIFFLIDLLFIGLAADALGWGHGWHTMAAWSELLIALVGFYGAAASTLNTHFGKQFLPTGKPFGIFK